MDLRILNAALVLFLLFLFFHVIFWRWFHPKKQAHWFLLVFSLPVFIFIPYANDQSLGMIDLFAIGLAYLALGCAYIQVYPACQALSPSLMVLLLIGKAMPQGLTEKEICSHFADNILLENRVQDLLISGLIRDAGNGQFEITARGLMIVLPGMILRKMLGLSAGRG